MLSERSRRDTKDHTPYKFVLYDVDRRQPGGSQGLGEWKEWGTGSGPITGVGFLWGDENVLGTDNQTDVVVTQYCECAKCH